MKKNIIILVLVFYSLPAFSMVDFDAYVHVVPYNKERAFEWSAVAGAEGYELYIWQLESSKRFLSGKIVYTNKHSVLWKTHGHYIVYVRWFKTIGGVQVFGEWANSLDPSVGVVNGQPKAWVIYVMQPNN